MTNNHSDDRPQLDILGRPISPEQAAAQLARERASEHLWAMTARERVAAMRAGKLSRDHLFEWARKAPAEVPLLEGEREFVAVHTTEIADRPARP